MTDELVNVAQYQFGPEAEAVRMRLQAEGIPAFLANAETLSMTWLLGNAIGYVKVQVPRSRADEALAILDAAEDARCESDEHNSEPRDNQRCLACGAAMAADQRACGDCGWSYADDEGETPDEEIEDDANDHTSVDDEPVSAMESLRSVKRPILIFLMFPGFMFAAAVAAAVLGRIVSLYHQGR